MKIQWYPGHMTKAMRAMKEDVKLVDLIIELVDARAPMASRNPDIDELGKGKGRLILLNKADLASEAANAAWTEFFKGKGFQVMRIDARSKSDLKADPCPYPGSLQRKDRTGPETGDLKPSGPRDGRGNPQRREIDVHQQPGGKGVGQNGK